MNQSRLTLIIHWVLWVTRLRWFAVIGLITVLAASRHWWNFQINYPWLWMLAALFLFYNICSYILSQGKFGFNYLTANPLRFVPFAFFQIFMDLLLLTLILHFAGGVENPFFFFYIFHVSISSILFSRTRAYLNALIAGVLLNLLFLAEYHGWIAHYHLTGLAPASLYQNSFYLLCLGNIMALTLLAAAYMSSFLVEHLREREIELEEAHELLLEQSNSCEVSYAELQTLHKEKSDFMRMVAHELRAPLSAIQSCLQVALEYFGEQLSGKPKELIERAEKRSGGLIALVRDLLNLSRAEEVIRFSRFERVDLREILKNVVELAKPNAQKNQIQIDCQLGKDPLVVQGDKGGLEEVFTNIISNAIKYSPPEAQVRITVENNSREIKIHFRDQGIGISSQDMKQLFSEFFRAANAKALQVEGTGLGLALTKKIVAIHGGTIEVESRLDQGSCFTVILPQK